MNVWAEITELLTILKAESYIDDQVEITEIWNIVEELLVKGGFEKEPWELRKRILEEIIGNFYYDDFGVCDPMMDLCAAMCTDRSENLVRAEIMMNQGSEFLGREAAKLYLELGEDDIFVQYFEQRLGRQPEPYQFLLDYYKERDTEKAVEIAGQAVKKCSTELSPFFLVLLQDAKDRNDEAAFKRLMRSARKRTGLHFHEEIAALIDFRENGER